MKTRTRPFRRTSQPRRRHAARAAGYTLIELSLSLGVMAVLGVAMASAIVLCARAVPGGDGGTPEDATVLAARAAQQVAGELHYALDVTETTPTAVTFTVADRDGDGAPERIRYAWSGKSGDPLTRQYNDGPADVALADVKDFELTYTRNAVTATRQVTTAGTTPELLLAFFNTYASGNTTDKTYTLSTLAFASERILLDPAAVPAGTRKVNFTRAKVWMKGGGGLLSLSETASLQLRTAGDGLGGGGYAPGGGLGPATSLAASSLPSSYNWVEFPISGTTLPDPAQPLCLVLWGGLLSGSTIQYKFNSNAPMDDQVMTWSPDAGVTWNPSTKLNQQDIRFYLYGTCAVTNTTQVTSTEYFLTGAGVRVRGAAAGANPAYTSASVPEHPQVGAP